MLAGGTGGAKLARGMLDVAGDDLVVIANTGDDIEIHGGHVSPDPDLVTFWLADRIDERGWGLRDDTFARDGGAARARRGRLVQPRRPDLAVCLARARRLADGRDADRRGRRAAARASACRRAVLPMSDAAGAHAGPGRAGAGTGSRSS